MAMTWAAGSCKAACDARAARLNSGFLRLYSAGAVLLAELTFGATAFGAGTNASPSVATANAIGQDPSANASGTAATFSLYQSDGTTLEGSGTVTATGGGGDIELLSTAIVAGQPVTITALSISQS